MNNITLREYQAAAINRSLEALTQHNNTLLVVPTGGGKSVCLSSLISEFVKQSSTPVKILVLQHRKEIINQNIIKFKEVDHTISVSEITQDCKDDSGTVVFAMIQTLHRNADMVKKYDLIVVDEAHHAIANSYLTIINKVRELNPEAKIYGVTATPLRGDGKRLINIFDNISYSIEIEELISCGVLVKPTPYVIDIGLEAEIEKKTQGNTNISNLELDMLSSEIIQSSIVDLHKAFACWQEVAGDRKTVVFTPTNKESVYISDLFNQHGVETRTITHDTPKKEREQILNAFTNGDVSVLFNTSILTEGWDCPAASCIVLFKSSSYKATYIQMVGRGLRSHPGKKDCIIIDFGISTKRHGSLEQNIFKSIKQKEEVEKVGNNNNYYKTCSACSAQVPVACKICFICGNTFESEESKKQVLEDFKLKEVNLIKAIEVKCKYLFVPVDNNKIISVVDNKSYIGIFETNGHWRIIGNILSDNNYTDCYHLSKSKAECYEVAHKLLRSSKNKSKHMKKTNEWLNLPPSDKQIHWIMTKTNKRVDPNMNRYEAACLLTYLFNKRSINQWL